MKTPNPHAGADALREAIDKLDGITKFARALSEATKESIKSQTVANWMSRGIPMERCLDIEKLTGIPCERLNPDIDWKKIREVLCAPGRITASNSTLRKTKQQQMNARVA
jgi:DNA-binding transcriptional regulator YdaS (Cro superfamily)